MTQGAGSVVFRGGTVLTIDATHRVLPDADVLVIGDRIAAVGPDLAVPEGTREIDASGGIVMPGMIDTHRHMWQTAMRGYGADWTLTQYFVWYYLESGRHFRPEDVHAGNLLAALEALDAGVTTTRRLVARPADHEPRRGRRRRAARGPRPVRARLRQHPAGAVGVGHLRRTSGLRSPPPRRDDDLLGFQMAFDVTGDPAFPERAAFEVARELGVPVTTHAGVWGATNDDGIRLIHENGFLDETSIYVHAATLSADSYHRIAATGGSVSVSTESEQSAGQGYPPTLGAAAARHPGVAVDGHQRVVERRPVLRDADDARRRPLPRAPRGARQGRHGHQPRAARRAGRRVGHPRRRPGARPRTDLGSLEVGKKADVVLIKNDHSPVLFPILNPYGHVAFQAQRGDVHTVLVERARGEARAPPRGRRPRRGPARRSRRRSSTCAPTLGDEAWAKGMNPDVPETTLLDNPYQYTDYGGAMPGR